METNVIVAWLWLSVVWLSAVVAAVAIVEARARRAREGAIGEAIDRAARAVGLSAGAGSSRGRSSR